MTNVINMFDKTKDQLKAFDTMNLEDSIKHFHDKLDEAMGKFHSFSVMEKYELAESLTSMNKQLFQMYVEQRGRNLV